MEVLGLIPARGGSKGIPHKNIALLAGRPLLAYTCEAALASQRLTRIILDTDESKIADIGRQCGVEAPFLRPAELAKDDTPILEVLQRRLRTLQESENYVPEIVVLLQPTSPLRKAGHIDAAVDLLVRTGADSVVSVTEVPHQFNPVSLMCLDRERLVPVGNNQPLPTRRQDKPKLYARNGPAVLVVRREVLLKKNSLYGEDCRPLVMNPEESVDIDDPNDLLWAEFLLTRNGNRK